jgi:hypothetical protein
MKLGSSSSVEFSTVPSGWRTLQPDEPDFLGFLEECRDRGHGVGK